MTLEIEPLPRRINLLTVAQLVRLPNVFTAIADIMLGFLFTHESFQPVGVFALLVLASALLYSAGMVLNDVFDNDVDALQRPGRPIPSGRITLQTAATLGFGMLGLGAAMAWGAGFLAVDELRDASVWRSGATATLLAIAIVLYDRVLKRTPLAPLVMGSCRFLNVLLGMSASPFAWGPVNYLVAAGVGVYIVGVTIFARTEAEQSSRPQLMFGLVVMVLGIALLAWFPSWETGDEPMAINAPPRWLLFWTLIGMLIGWRCVVAIRDPMPETVQSAVKNSLMSLIIIDAGAVVAVQTPLHAMMILALIVPMMLLGRRLYST